MSLNMLDIILLICFAFGFLIGFKRGIIKQGVFTIGIFLVVFLSFVFKNSLSIILYKHLSFYTVGILRNYSVLNILLYELISFFILLSVLSLIFIIILKISGIVEKLVRATIILALPSKLLGGILGIIEIYIFSFIILLVINMPIFNISNEELVMNSKLKDKILNNTVLMSNVSKNLVKSIDSVNALIDSDEKLGSKEFNCKALNIFVKNKIISKDSINYLKNNNKIDKKCETNNN